MADHLGFFFGHGEAGLQGFPDPFDRHDKTKGNDLKNNAQHIRNSLRGIERNLGRNQTLRDFLRAKLEDEQYKQLTNALDDFAYNLQDGFYEGVIERELSQEIVDILVRTGYIVP